MNIEDLSKEFARDQVHWRVQGQPYERNGTFSAMALAYIDARDVMDRFDDAVGPENWQTEYNETPSGRVVCRIGVCIGEAWVWKSDGAGSTQVEGEKGGISDALKRAAVVWGVGRYLYRLDSPWVQCTVRNKNGKNHWKAWAEDPWSKVKVVGYTQPDQAAALHDAAVTAALRMIESETTLEGLSEYWADLAKNQKAVSYDAKVIAAKDKRKGELAQKESGPDEGDQIAADAA